MRQACPQLAKADAQLFQFSSTPSCRLIQEPIESLRLGVGLPLLHSGRARVVGTLRAISTAEKPSGVGGSRLSTRSVMTTILCTCERDKVVHAEKMDTRRVLRAFWRVMQKSSVELVGQERGWQGRRHVHVAGRNYARRCPDGLSIANTQTRIANTQTRRGKQARR